VKVQVKAELKALQKTTESFYTLSADKKTVSYDKQLVKDYLGTLTSKSWEQLKEKNSSAWTMAIQIALEDMGYEVGKIDGILKDSKTGKTETMQAIKKFQETNKLAIKD
jgi:hypothetical protein